MKAAVAIQRKLLELTYVIWKNNTFYNPGFFETKMAQMGGTNKSDTLILR